MVKRTILRELQSLSIPPKEFTEETLAYACAQLLKPKTDKRRYAKLVQELNLHLNDKQEFSMFKNVLISIANKIGRKIIFLKYRNSKVKEYKAIYPEKFVKNIQNKAPLEGVFILYHKKRYYFIKDYQALIKEYMCFKCLKYFTEKKNLNNHQCIDINRDIKLKHNPRIFRPRLTMVEELNDIGLKVPKDRKFVNYFAAFDIETYTTILKEKKTNKVEEIGEQTLANICIATNIPELEYYVFWNKNGNPENTIKNFVKYALYASKIAAEYHLRENQDIIDEAYSMYDMAMQENKKNYADRIMSVIKKFKSFLKRFTIFSYNGSNYDLKVMTSNCLFYYIHKYDGAIKPTRDTGPNTYLSITSDSLRFVDLIRYLGAPAPLSVALRNFGVTECELKDLQVDLTEQKCINNGLKLLFPYTSANNYDGLSGNFTPFAVEEFYSELTQTNLLSPHYEEYIELCKKYSEKEALKALELYEPPENPATVVQLVNNIMSELCLDRASYFSLYVTVDTVSTLKLAEKMYAEFRNMDIHSFFDCLTLSGMAFLYMHNSKSEVEKGKFNFFVNLDEQNYEFIKRGVVGGVSSSLNRLAIANLTKIRPHIFGSEAKVVKNIKVYDLNSLYTNVIADELSCCIGFPMTRLVENHFKISDINGSWPMEFVAMSYYSEKVYPGETIKTTLSTHGQHKIYLPELSTYTPLDGYIESLDIGINFHGCYYHGCRDCYPDDQAMHPNGKTWGHLCTLGTPVYSLQRRPNRNLWIEMG